MSIASQVLTKLKFPRRRSLSINLLIYVLLGALVGLGLVSFLLFQMLERQLKEQIQGQLGTKVRTVEVEVVQVKQALHSLSASVKTLNRQGIEDPNAYKSLILDTFDRRSELVTALGFGQTPSQIVPNRKGFWPYFSIDQQETGQSRQQLLPPHDNIFYSEVDNGQYFDKFYYLDVIRAGQPIWLEPYDWFGNTLTTYTEPIWNDAGEIIGVSGLDMNLTKIYQLLNTPVASNKGYFILLSAKGNLLSYPPDPIQAQKLNSYESIPILRQAWQQISTQKNLKSGILQIDQAYLAYQRVEGTEWVMLAVVPRSEVLTSVIAIVVGGALLAGVLLTGIVSLFIKKLNDRLQPIVARCQQLCSRQLDTADRSTTILIASLQTHERNTDEIDILEETVEYMAAQLTATLEGLEQRVVERTTELSQALQTLQMTQAQLIQSEKMSSLGQMVAGIAHEINNPNNFIHGNLQYLEDCFRDLLNLLEHYPTEIFQTSPQLQQKLNDLDLPFLQEDLPQLFSSMRAGTERIRMVVRSLRSFSRLDEAGLKLANLHDCLDSTLAVLESRFNEINRLNISVIRKYDQNLPEVECYVGELNQVFFNILTNAIDAIEAKANDGIKNLIEIRTENRDGNWIVIYISDTGMGISDEARTRIFDPFFTTKPVGKGTGLGLSISYQIVTQQHNGKLWCDSAPGKGTKFCIEIPTGQTMV